MVPNKNKCIFAIDPGFNGGVAWHIPGEGIQVAKLLREPRDMFHQLASISKGGTESHCVLENVGFYRPGNSAVSAVKFGNHMGHIEMALAALGVRVTKVVPSKWMRWLLPDLPKDKTRRKRAIRDEVQKRHPDLKIILATSDALGILEYAISELVF